MPPGVAQSTPEMHEWTEQFMIDAADDLKYIRSSRTSFIGHQFQSLQRLPGCAMATRLISPLSVAASTAATIHPFSMRPATGTAVSATGLFANDIAPARTAFSTDATSPFHLLGLGLGAFLEAALGMESGKAAAERQRNNSNNIANASAKGGGD
ncbi:hypothetical protein DFH08DRAFT_1013384 [Mycena albidolilacea]|uniref:Uncharacterized protein n=1 Tax=Mycena albidolilacea TaxID=1033008 RepID=A0AAD6ZVC8_9AGAR|nr:hypothetical protein DFH08DRAFT_1013384 [Mycena albidolilacea]